MSMRRIVDVAVLSNATGLRPFRYTLSCGHQYEGDLRKWYRNKLSHPEIAKCYRCLATKGIDEVNASCRMIASGTETESTK